MNKHMMLELYIDGIAGHEVNFSEVPNGNAAFQYALGKVEEDRKSAIYRRRISEAGTYGGWRWAGFAHKLLTKGE